MRLTTLELPAKSEQNFIVKIKPSLNASDGIYPVLVGAVSGDEALSDVQLEIQEVSGISTQIRSFGTIEKLEAGESRNIPVEITARADAGSGIKEIFMRAKSGDIQGEEKTIKVNVEKSGSSGIAGIGMVVIAIVALVFIIRKFGRR